MASIAISFLVMIIAISVSSGFRREIRAGISTISGDIQLIPLDQNFLTEDQPIDRSVPWLTAVQEVDGVRETVPAVYRPGIIKHGDRIHGVLFKGVPGGGDSLGVSVPSRLAGLLGVEPGDPLLTYFIGEKVKVRRFRVQSVYQSVLSSDDNLVVFAGLEDMQRLNGWDSTQVSALELLVEERCRDNAVLTALTADVGTRLIQHTPEDAEGVLAVSVLSKYPQIFSWLDLIDTNVLFILLLMTVVAGFNMISGLLILLFRNISTIGTLKSMGMTDRHISEVFLRVAAVLVGKGMLIGNALAGLFCLIQGKTHLIHLDPENYFLSFVPVHLPLPTLLAVDLGAFLAIMLLLLIPCLFVSRVDPAKTVRSQ